MPLWALGAKMHEEIGTTAGAIWQTLDNNGELSLPSLKQQVGARSPFFDWALGWRERTKSLFSANKGAIVCVLVTGRLAPLACSTPHSELGPIRTT
jgi:hypothetical protein